MKFLQDYKFRQWLYGVFAAILVVLAGYGFITAEEQDNILRLIEALLNLAIASGFGLAARNAQPSQHDVEVSQDDTEI